MLRGCVILFYLVCLTNSFSMNEAVQIGENSKAKSKFHRDIDGSSIRNEIDSALDKLKVTFINESLRIDNLYKELDEIKRSFGNKLKYINSPGNLKIFS